MSRSTRRTLPFIGVVALACSFAAGCDSGSKDAAACEPDTPCACENGSVGVRTCGDAALGDCECSGGAAGAAGMGGAYGGAGGTSGSGGGGTSGSGGISGSGGTSGSGGISGSGGASGSGGGSGCDNTYLSYVDCTGEDPCGYWHPGCSVTCADETGEIVLDWVPAKVRLPAVTTADPDCCAPVQRMYWIRLSLQAGNLFPYSFYKVNPPWKFARTQGVNGQACVVNSSQCATTSRDLWVVVYTDDPSAPPADVYVDQYGFPECM